MENTLRVGCHSSGHTERTDDKQEPMKYKLGLEDHQPGASTHGGGPHGQHFSCAYSSQPPNGERLGSVWITKFRFLKAAAGCGSVLTALAHCFVLLGSTKCPAGFQEQWRICLLPTAPACLDSVVSLATRTRAPSVPHKGRRRPGGGRRPATVLSVTSLPSQTAVLARENQQRQDQGQHNPTTCADIKRYRLLTFRLFCSSAFLDFF